MNNSIKGIHKEIKASGQKLENATNLKRLDVIIQINYHNQQFCQKLSNASIWNDQNGTRSDSKSDWSAHPSYSSFFALSIALTADLPRRIKAMAMVCYYINDAFDT